MTPAQAAAALRRAETAANTAAAVVLETAEEQRRALAPLIAASRAAADAVTEARAALALARMPADQRELLAPERPADGELVARGLAEPYCHGRDRQWTDLGQRVRALWLAERGGA